MAASGPGHEPTDRPLVTLPKYADTLTIGVRLPAGRSRLLDILSVLEPLPKSRIGPERDYARITLAGGRLAESHVHLTVDEEDTGDGVDIQFTAFPFASRVHAPDYATVEQAIAQLQPFVASSDGAATIVVSCSFTFPLTEWVPTVKLPFTPPGMMEGWPGRPQISGVDFDFTELGPDQPLQRAFVTTFGAVEQMVVRILLSFAARWNDDLTYVAVTEVARQIPVFVRQRVSQEVT